MRYLGECSIGLIHFDVNVNIEFCKINKIFIRENLYQTQLTFLNDTKKVWKIMKHTFKNYLQPFDFIIMSS